MNEATTSLSVCKYSTQSGLKVEPCARPEPTVMEQTRITAVTQHLLSVFDKTCQLCCFLISGFWLTEATATRRFHCSLCAFSILWTWSESCQWSAGRWNTEVNVSPIKPGANCSCDLWLGLGGLTKNLHHRLFKDSCGFTVRTYLGLLNQTWNTENW